MGYVKWASAVDPLVVRAVCMFSAPGRGRVSATAYVLHDAATGADGMGDCAMLSGVGPMPSR
jgi:hypothetical protein